MNERRHSPATIPYKRVALFIIIMFLDFLEWIVRAAIKNDVRV